ncbi:MAG: response regulator transcription factor [Lactobacillales bacterium]|jgi:DNA-binding response OmpR family regulator|nr:response regulator transcription factor [Lactobacillales bacterium]
MMKIEDKKMDKFKLLICDDDADIRGALKIYLTGAGYDIVEAENGKEAVEIAQKEDIQLILMDVMMPVLDGIMAAVRIREFSNVPIIFLSAKTEDSDRILGLEMGGDDYITKPFIPGELFARVKSALRRYSKLGGVTGEIETGKNVYQTGDLVVDDNKKLVTLDGETVDLTALEYNILKLMASHLDSVFSSEHIYESVWEEPAFDTNKTVSVHIRHIREKIEANPKEPKYLKVVYGLGYKVVKI